MVNNEIAVTHSDSNDILIGDIVKTIDGTDAAKTLDSLMQLFSGSDQLKRRRALMYLTHGDDKLVKLSVVRKGTVTEVTTIRTTGLYYRYVKPVSKLKFDIKNISKETYYINLVSAKYNDVLGILDEVSNAKYVILDARGYITENFFILSHLLKNVSDNVQRSWISTPQIIYPNMKKVRYLDMSWYIDQVKPTIKGRIFILVDESAISATETFLLQVRMNNLGTIVGLPTAGVNGNVNRSYLFNQTLNWTGMRVVALDGERFNGIGILPDIYVKREIDTLHLSRDEFFETALLNCNER